MRNDELGGWQPRPRPARKTLEGTHVRLEPLDPGRHGDQLFECSTVPDAPLRFRWLGEYPPAGRAAFQPWLEQAEGSEDPLYFAVIDRASGRVGGRQTFMRIDQANGVIEIGNIYWGPSIARRAAATEALFLFADYAFGELGYRRFEWKCNNLNGPSKRAAERFGFTFEGVFRQHMVVKEKNRDTAWYAMLDRDWPLLRQAYLEWLDPANFDGEGRQRRRLGEIRSALAGGRGRA